MLSKAIEIASKAHDGQFDISGNPYILHPLKIMLWCDNDTERICAVLHDVMEDSPITLNDLRNEGFSEDILEVLDCLTKRKNESYDNYIDRVIKNEIACNIKIKDLCHNMDLTRIKNPSLKDEKRNKKYSKALDKLMDALPYADAIPSYRMISIDGHIEVQPFVSQDEFLDRFINFVENQGWSFGGGTKDVTYE